MADEVEVFDISDITERAVKTFLEAFVVALPSSLVFSDVPAALDVAGAAAAGAAVAAASVVLNAILQFARSRRSRVQL